MTMMIARAPRTEVLQALAEALNIRKGEIVQWSVEDGALVLRRLKR